MTQPSEHLGYVETRLTLLPATEGGRQTPIRSGYTPNFWLPGTPERRLASATVQLVDRDELVPGSQATARIYPFAPEIWGSIGVGAALDVTEGPRRVVGRAVVTRVVPAAVPIGS
jgi:hypothetical protein